MTNNILIHGLWQSETEVENMLSSYETEKLEALKSQLKFQKEVILQIQEHKQTFNNTKVVEGQKSRKSMDSKELSVYL